MDSERNRMQKRLLSKERNNHMLFAVMTAAALLLLLGLCLTGCSAKPKSYRVDYCGGKSFYSNAKNTYKAGQCVELHFDMVATDTDYTFYLDGDPNALTVQGNGNGFVLRFVMPAHDVRLDYSMRNSMEYVPESTDDSFADPND